MSNSSINLYARKLNSRNQAHIEQSMNNSRYRNDILVERNQFAAVQVRNLGESFDEQFATFDNGGGGFLVGP